MHDTLLWYEQKEHSATTSGTIRKNFHPYVSVFMKYTVLQVKHVCQQDVGIFMNGKLLAPEMKLLDVVKQWMAIVCSERKITEECSSENFCVKLTFARRE
uniref:Uncharacterized protein n=1 Tax=Lactuca sativa TaxID=4236 RepID=A0A9R1VKJ1_LACSA|nr:hypothetical protein LSAT_V11C500254360 [Lactuca sativa]